MYRLWVDNSLSKQFADDILVYKEGKTVSGMVTYKQNKDKASVGLIAVSPEAQGKGIGKKITASIRIQFISKKTAKHCLFQHSEQTVRFVLLYQARV